MIAIVIAWALATVVMAWGLTALIRQYAFRRSLVDVPNHRSSHVVPTPRGGGLAIVLAMLAAWGGMPVLDIGNPGPWGAVGAALVVAIVGFIDDHNQVPAGLRLLAHVGAAAIIVWELSGLPAMHFASLDLSVAPVGPVLAVLLVAWWVNLTNFMDGVDGIAGTYVVVVCLAGASLNAVAGNPLPEILGPVALAAATFGFLMWNWPPARIFMGDVGSGFVGAMIAVFTLRAGHYSPELGWAWVILAGAFVVDASVTLFLRMIRRERLSEAHRSHAYQYLARRWASHRKVTLFWAGATVLWLFPCALAVASGAVAGWIATVVAYLPLTIVALLVQRRAAAQTSEMRVTC